MTDDRFPSAADDEMLSAYLLDELDEDGAEAFEARLAADPALAEQLDVLAAALTAMGRHDAAEPPAGFEQRLDDRLAQARSGAGEVASLDAARERRAGSGRWWTTIGTVAAVVALGAVMATGALRGVGGGDMAADDSADSSGALHAGGEEAQEEAMTDDSSPLTAGGDAGAGSAADERADADTYSAEAPLAARPNTPVLLDDQARVADEDALQDRYADAPEVVGLLGMPVEEAATVAASFSSAVQRAEGYSDGGGPGDCLDTVTTAADQPLIPARVETLRYARRPALSYVLVTASPDAAELDRVEVWVVAPQDCTTLVFHQF